MNQPTITDCPISTEKAWLDIQPHTSIEELHKHYKHLIEEHYKKCIEWELKEMPSDDLYLWFNKHGGEKNLVNTTYLMHGGLHFSCPDEFLTGLRFKTCTRHQLPEIVVMAMEKQI